MIQLSWSVIPSCNDLTVAADPFDKAAAIFDNRHSAVLSQPWAVLLLNIAERKGRIADPDCWILRAESEFRADVRRGARQLIATAAFYGLAERRCRHSREAKGRKRETHKWEIYRGVPEIMTDSIVRDSRIESIVTVRNDTSNDTFFDLLVKRKCNFYFRLRWNRTTSHRHFIRPVETFTRLRETPVCVIKLLISVSFINEFDSSNFEENSVLL